MSRAVPAFAALLLAACSYPVEAPQPAPAPVVAAYADKVPGKWVLMVDASKANVALQATGMRCGQSDYPLDFTKSVPRVAEATFKTVADEVRLSDHPLSRSELESGGYTGVLMVRVTDFHSALATDGILAPHASARTEIGGTLVVSKDGQHMVDTHQTGAGDAERDAGIDCGGASGAVSAASDAAVEDFLGKLAEQFANSRAVRNSPQGLAPQ